MILYHGTNERLAKLAPLHGFIGELTDLAPTQAFLNSGPDERWGIIEVKSAKKLKSIPPQAISKVWIFNPKSNWLVTRSVLHGGRNLVNSHRWLTGQFVTIDEWLGSDKKYFTKKQTDELKSLLMDRSGLDVYYHGPSK